MLPPLFRKYLNPQVRINNKVCSVDYHPCPSRLASRIYPFTFLKTPQGLVSLSPECLLSFLSNLHIPPCVGKTFEFMVFKFLENTLNLGIFTYAPLIPFLKLAHKFLSPHSKQMEITHSPRQHFFELCFPQQRKGVEEIMICFIKIQSENVT